MGAEEQEMRPHRHSSADVPIGVLTAPHLHMLVGTWLLGTPRRWVLGATSPRFPHHSLTRFAAAKEPSQQAQGCSATEHCLAGCRTAALLCHTGKRETQGKKKNQTSAGRGEAPALPEVLSRLCCSQGPGKTLAAAPSGGAGRGGGQCRVWCSRAVLNRGFH